MRKNVKRALACAAAAVLAGGLTFAAACSGNYYSSAPLDGSYEYDEVVSNGGFAVQAGDWVYFINGVESNTADSNSYGDVVKGSLVRISLENLAAGNYSDVQTVVPLIMYSGDYDAGIYIYGDYVYYSTPSTARDSSGEVLNTRLEFKSTKLDGTETMTDYYFQSENTDLDYRFMEVDGTVYLVYATSEILYGTESRKNIHSVNLKTRTDTLLAYDVDSYAFDSLNTDSQYVYYTMGVTYNLGTDNASDADYNQVYRVRADAKAEKPPREYNFDYVEDFDAEEDPLYVNLGEFVFDGRGVFSGMTQFNYGYRADSDSDTSSDDANTLSGYTYEIVSYEDGKLYYTRTNSGDSAQMLLYVKDSEMDEDGDGKIDKSWNPVTGNPSAPAYGGKSLLYAASNVSGYNFVTNADGVPTGVIYTKDITNGYALMSATFSGGALTDIFPMATASDEINILTTSEETVNDTAYTFLYYSVSGEGNEYSIHRIALGGTDSDYNELPSFSETEAMSNYDDTKILDLDVVSTWYMPEILGGHIFFATATTDMTDYDYIMAFDLRDEGVTTATNVTMSNDDIEALNDLYDSVIGDEEGNEGIIASIDEEDFQNLPNALRFAFYAGASQVNRVDELIADWVDEGEDEEYLFSVESAEMYKDFINATGTYADLAEEGTRKVNGADLHPNTRDYFYCLVGVMTEDDAENYIEDLAGDYLPAAPTTEEGWFESLSTGEKVGFIIGVCAGGIIIIAAAVLIPVLVIRKKKKTLPQYNKKRIKVDTTDDRDIDVYASDEPQDGDSENK